MLGLFLIKEAPELQLSCEFCKNFKNFYFVEYLQVAISVLIKLYWVLIKGFSIQKSMELQNQNNWRPSLHLLEYLSREAFNRLYSYLVFLSPYLIQINLRPFLLK